jgi:protein-S-isoprenylcysteine O-methyltransferase Ste14
MPVEIKVVVFILATMGIAWISRSSLRDVQSHGFYRFFAWEAILLLFLLNMDYWFVDALGLRQIVSWTFLIVSLVFIYEGVRLFRQQGKLDQTRNDPGLVGIEKTTVLVTSGLYHYVRHPFYSSLLFLGWGIFLKNISWTGLLLVGAITVLLVLTAKIEETENIQYFGDAYREYMKHTKMFIPFVF